VTVLCKTLFGDARNAAVVAALIAVASALTLGGQAAAAGYVVPPLILAGVGWLAVR
jgi:hypothetical protein